CAPPAPEPPSSRDPTPPQTPTDADRTAGRYSVTTRRPPGSVVRRRRVVSASTNRLPRRRAPAGPGRAPDASATGRRGIGRSGRLGRPGICGGRIGGVLLRHPNQGDL